jgi:hypothetical protein
MFPHTQRKKAPCPYKVNKKVRLVTHFSRISLGTDTIIFCIAITFNDSISAPAQQRSHKANENGFIVHPPPEQILPAKKTQHIIGLERTT